MVPNLRRCMKSPARHDVQIAEARIAFALCRYERDDGGYPETLHSLVPANLSQVPIDAFSGNEMHYLRKDPAYVLYSTGPDGVDGLGSDAGKEEQTAAEVTVRIEDEVVWGEQAA